MVRYLRQHSLGLFFGLTFLLSWLIWVPMALDRYSLLGVRLDPGFVLVGRLFGTLGPAVSAILVSLFLGGKPALGRLLGQYKKHRLAWRWYAAAALVFPALVFVTAGLYRLLPGSTPLPIQPVTAGGLVVTAIILTISVLGEETGWRGFALPRLQERRTALGASLVLGSVHTLWHLPFWLVLGELERFGWGYWLLSLAWVLALTIFLTWVMNNTGNSLLLAFLCHWSLNMVTVGYLPITTVIPAYIIFAALAWAVALGLLARYDAADLRRRPGDRLLYT